MNIRHARIEDLHDVALVHVESWRAAYRGIVANAYLENLSVKSRQSDWEEIFTGGGSELLVADAPEGIIGFSSFGKSRDSDKVDSDGEIYAIYVAPGHWSEGVGAALWRNSLTRLVQLGYSTATAWVLSANERAIRFYQRAGFELCRESTTTVNIGGEVLPEVRYEISIA